MCGIAGIACYRADGPRVNRDELVSLRDAMAQRGPDGAGIWIAAQAEVGLAHRRLSIIDLSDAGAQPMAANGLQIVFNGEIYNYRALRAELEGAGFRFTSHSDTEVLLHLYMQRGADMVAALRGMYAFAIWDERNRGLLLARDPFGIKPLYYADDGTTVRFASQVKALKHVMTSGLAPDSAGHAGFFLWGSVPEPYTLYKGIRALPAGHTRWFDTRGAQAPRRFFNIADEFSSAESAAVVCDPRALDARLRALLVDSVRHHLVADVPVGVFLSAGLDSATLTAIAAEELKQPLRTVTLGFSEYRGSERDEVPLAQATATHYGAVQRTRWVTRDEFSKERERLLQAMDQPSIDGVNTYFVSKAAAETGLKVAISGLGGDELFAGYPSFRDVPRMASCLAPFRLFPALGRGFRWVSAPLLKQFTSPKYAGLFEYGGSIAGAYLLRRGFFMPWELPDVIGSDMAREGWEALQTLTCLDATIDGLRSDRLRVSALEMNWYMRNQLLRDADWAGMAHSLEIRVPLVDIELLRGLAPLLAQRNAPTKRALGRTPRKALPAAVLNRPKTGFSIPVREWLMGGGNPDNERGLRGWARQVLPT